MAVIRLPDSFPALITPTTPKYKLLLWLVKQWLKSRQALHAAALLYVACELRAYVRWRRTARRTSLSAIAQRSQ